MMPNHKYKSIYAEVLYEGIIRAPSRLHLYFVVYLCVERWYMGARTFKDFVEAIVMN